MSKKNSNQKPEGSNREYVAIIGMSGYFPRSKSLETFLEGLENQKSFFTKIPQNHFPDDSIQDRYGAFLTDVSSFDPEIFNISPSEAQHLDPRQRLLLMSVWHTLEDACYLPSNFHNSLVDVYIASEGSPYLPFTSRAGISAQSAAGVSSWALPNRISHQFKFKGRSLFLDTACSGGSVALHEAMRSLRNDEADYVMVGAANLLFGEAASHAFLGQERLGILNNSKTCYPFQKNAEGFLPAEGIATVLLKKLSRALADHDNIHAVLLGSHVNHVGGNGSLIAPSSESQSDAIMHAYLDAGIDPSTVTYIEAHAASSLYADSEEIKAFALGDRKLKEMFKSSEDIPCKISTAKPNIGHANSVSGLFSLMRVIHSFKIKKKLGIKELQECSHAEVLESTRFYINSETENWDRLTTSDGSEIPRRAAINNYGAGGTNVHIVLEEAGALASFEERVENETPGDQSYFLTLSTLSEKQLTEYVRAIQNCLDEKRDITPAELEFIYMTKRCSLPVRVAFRYKELNELKGKLNKYVDSGGNLGFYVKGNLDDDKCGGIFQKHPKLSAFLETLNQQTDKSLLVELWANGVAVQLDRLYAGRSYAKQSLPRYPFKNSHYWIYPYLDQKVCGSDSLSGGEAAVFVHPLLGEYLRDSRGHRFKTEFSGSEFLLADHVVNGHKILPGVVYLEMVRAALAHVAQTSGKESAAVRLEHVAWTRPFNLSVNDNKLELLIETLKFEHDERIQFQIQSSSSEDEGEVVVHAHGTMSLLVPKEYHLVDISKLKTEVGEVLVTATQCYEGFKSLGIHHGPGYRAVREIYVGDPTPDGQQALAQLCLPSFPAAIEDQYILHPSIMDSATQASIGILMDPRNMQAPGAAKESFLSLKPYLPFALDELEVIGPCTERMWAWVQMCNRTENDDRLKKLDIVLLDEQGRIRVTMKGFSLRRIDVDPFENKQYSQKRAADGSRNTQNVPAISPLVSDEEKIENMVNNKGLEDASQKFFKNLFARILKVPSFELAEGDSFEEYGLNSLMVVDVTNELERIFGSLPKTLLFEYRTLSELRQYFLEFHKESLETILALKRPEVKTEKRRSKSNAQFSASAMGRLLTERQPPSDNAIASYGVESLGASPLDVAIIGVSCRFPKARDLDEYWENLENGRDCVTEIPNERWDWRKYYTTDRTKSGHHSKWGGFIDGVDEFDPLFFNISPKEAELLDPQERLFLEHAWIALEDAGYTRASLQSIAADSEDKERLAQVGVYAGVMYNEYQLLGVEESIRGNPIGFASSIASIANRVSYVFNLHGPSLAIDTMCSSSLTAINLACQDLRMGRTKLGIAGGVNVIIHPNKYSMLSAGRFISTRGQCQSFGEGGDGYIPGEGVGVVLLKRLIDAERDGDQIYCVIKGCATSHGGRTNGYTVPNPTAQRSVIERALKESRVNPRAVSYIEAHGTGTKLGDPIEIAGLSKAFHQSENRKHCRIGSVKSNIGHSESAAGVAGLIKVLLQMKHHKIVPSLHSRILNENIEFDNSPFVVNQELIEWERPIVDGKAYPRIAGISSFGAGGSNAHVIVEEYVKKNRTRGNQDAPLEKHDDCSPKPAIILLSANTQDQIREYAGKLLRFIRGGGDRVDKETKDSQENLIDLAYTLQVGREAMDERLGMVVTSTEELEDALEGFIENRPNREITFYTGQTGRTRKDSLSAYSTDKDLLTTIEAWIDKGKYGNLLDLWVRGLDIEWRNLYVEKTPMRISAPTYPFSRERYWFTLSEDLGVNNRDRIEHDSSVIHPLLHLNTSTLHAQRFSTRLTGEEFFLRDHKVMNQKMLPAVAYLEMIYVAVKNSVNGFSEKSHRISLNKVVWMRPVVVERDVLLHIKLTAVNNKEIAYEIYSNNQTLSDEPVVHAQGWAIITAIAEEAPLDIEKLKERLDESIVTAQRCYEEFDKLGIHYGPTFQGLNTIYKGENEVLATLAWTDHDSATPAQFTLHPSILDSALQAYVGLRLGCESDSPETSIVSVPFSLDSLEIVRSFDKSMCVWLRYSHDMKACDQIVKIDMDLCDNKGRICAKLRGLSTRNLGNPRDATIVADGRGSSQETECISTLLVKPTWHRKPLTVQKNVIEFSEHHVFLCDSTPHSARLATKGDRVRFRALIDEGGLKGEDLGRLVQQCSVSLFNNIRKIIKEKPKGNVLVQVVVPTEGSKKMLAALRGILLTAALEDRKIFGQTILMKCPEVGNELEQILVKNGQCVEDKVILYEGDDRKIMSLEELDVSDVDRCLPWKEGGVYLISGGAGVLGRMFANEIANTVKNATIVLTGRSKLEGADIEVEALKKLISQGVSVIYRQVDVSSRVAVTSLIKDITERYGDITGVIHAAGVIKDNYIWNKSSSEFAKVLAPKVEGVLNLDHACKDVSLDFFVMFSSMSGVMGNIGQADYSTANAFIDSFASYRRELGREGITLSINWPLWQVSGMHVDNAVKAGMKREFGIIPMETESGMEAFYKCMVSGLDQVMVVSGIAEKIRNVSKINRDRTDVAGEGRPTNDNLETLTVSDQSRGSILNKVQQALIRDVSVVLKIDVEKIRTDKRLHDYGFDSISLTVLANHLNETFSLTLVPTNFLEYPTIEEVSQYIVEEYNEVLSKDLAFPEKNGGVGGRQENVARSWRSEDPIELIPAPSSGAGDGMHPANRFRAEHLRERNEESQINQVEVPELVRLNDKEGGRPIFWIHDISGGVQSYYKIARMSERPFYAIQAQLGSRDRNRVFGIPNIAAHYIGVIQAIQPEGPYDLGGFSLGGLLSYEISRQLQSAGQKVETIVMLDTPDSINIPELINPSPKSTLLSAANYELLSVLMPDPKKIKETLIHRDELNAENDYEEYFQEITQIARKRGMRKTEAEWRDGIEKRVSARVAYDLEGFSILPLENPRDLVCYYFRNKNGLFYGDLAPFYVAEDYEEKLGSKKYWRIWQKHIGRFDMIEVEASSHVMLLSEPDACNCIMSFCRELYALKGARLVREAFNGD